jgi:ABC-type transport system substrate-binding protein
MKTKSILALALLAIMLASMFAAIPAPVVAADTGTSLFKITMIAPGNANLLRRQWALITANSFQSVGIDARVVFMGWGSVYDRALTPAAENIGKTWEQGGFDALFLGWTPGSPTTPFVGTFQIYYSKNIPPNNNYMLWNNSQSDLLLGQCLVQGYTTQGITTFKNWQELQYNECPAAQLFWTTAVMTADNATNFHGFEWLFDNIGPVPQFLSGATTVTMATTGELLNLNPPLSNSWYDTEAFSPIFDGLYALNTDLTLIPCIASADPTITNNGYSYIYPIRHNVTFQDGVEVTADDVVFTWLAYLNPASGSQQSATIAGYIGDDISFTWLNGTTTRLVLDLANGISYYPANSTTHGTSFGSLTAIDRYTVNVTISDFPGLGAPAATLHPEGEPATILPMHVLGKVAFADWKNDPYNTASGTYTANGQTFTGPIGAGPYSFVSYDATTQLVKVQKYDGYWNKTGLESQGLFTVNSFNIRYIADKDGAVAALKNHEVNILDAQYSLQLDYTSGNLNFAHNYLLPASGMQQLGYNMRSPIWGTGTATPLGQSDPSRAAEAARDVRIAFDYLIPRQLLVDNLLSGLGQPGGVHVNPVSPFYNTSIVPREYSPTLAKQYLAMAGYNTGAVVGGSTGGEETIGQKVGMYIVLESSTDNLLWTPISVGTTDALGNFYMTYAQNTTGLTYYHVVMTGIQIQKNLTTEALMQYWTIPGDTADLPTQLSGTTTNTEATPVTLSGHFNIAPYDAVSIFNAQQTTLNTKINNLNSTTTQQISSLNTQMAAQVASLNSAISNANNIGYAGIGIAIIALIAAVVLGMRKR